MEKGKFYIVQSRPITTLSEAGNEDNKGSRTVEQPKAPDFIFTFEAQGVTPLFQEVVCKGYMPPGSILLCPEGNVRSFVSKEMIKRMHKIGVGFFSNRRQVLSALTKLKQLIERANTSIREYNKFKSVTPDNVITAFKLMEKIHEEYSRFDSSYTDGAYKYAGKVTSILSLVEDHKNKIREKYNELFFAKVGGFITLLAAIAKKRSFLINDLCWCLEAEILAILKGKEIPMGKINERKKAYAFYKDQKNGIHFFEGEKAEKFIKGFEDKVPFSLTAIEGIVAHGAGKLVRGKAAIINSDYLNRSKVEKRMREMKKGEILVSVTTAPDLMKAFKKASAVITDVGGMLSHAAITARELDIPCIVGTQYASKILKDGDPVEVDANNGIVRILERNLEVKSNKFKLPIDKNEWEFEFQQRDQQSILMADFWCRAAFSFNKLLGLGDKPVDYFYTNLNNGYVNKAQKQRIHDYIENATEKDAKTIMKKTEVATKNALKIGNIIKDINLKNLSNEEIAELWQRFDQILLDAIPWFFMPYYTIPN